jgi:hypothetical protein
MSFTALTDKGLARVFGTRRPGRSPGTQLRRIRVRGSYQPAEVHVGSGRPVRLIFRREESAPCSERVVFPDYGISVTLPPFEDVPVDLPASEPGEHEFTCEMQMLHGTLVVDRHSRDPRDSFTKPSQRELTVRKQRSGARAMRRPEINITPVERVSRIAVGAAVAIAGVILLASGAGPLAIVLEALLVLAGLDLVVTGTLGHCPLYHKLGYLPPSLRRAP